MAYEVTATRKRPQSFDEMAGQEFVVSTLKSSIEQGRIAHAYLFSGPRGVGKTSAARILARSLNCEQGPTATPCGKCTACVEVARGNSLDVIEIDGASNTSVNDVREIKDEVLFAPNSSRYKIYIIDEVHMLSNSAFNALLKTIEEPPPYIVFIFATTEIHKVPATIRSRCQQFNFRLFSLETIRGLLDEVCKEGDIEAEEDALFWIAKEATGSMRDAYTLFDQVVSFAGSKITMELIRDKLGIAGLDALSAVAKAMASGEGDRVLSLASETLERGVSIEQYVSDLAEYFRSLLFIKHGIRKEALLGSTLDRFDSDALETFSVTQLEQAIALLLELYRNIRFSLNQRFELDLTLSRLASLSQYVTSGEILKKIQSIRSELAGGPPTDSGSTRRPSHSSARGQTSPRTSSGAGRPSESAGSPDVAAPAVERPSSQSPDPKGSAPASEAAVTAAPAQGGPQASVSRDEENEEYGYEDEWEPETEGGEAAGQQGAEDGLRRAVVDGLKKSKLNLSSALEKAVSWALSTDTLTITFTNGFQATLVKEEISVVAEKVAEILGRPVRVAVATTDGDDEPDAEGAVDENVELVKKIFRGEVIQGGDE